MAILDDIFGGQPFPADQIGGQEAMLMDLLRRLASGDAQTLQNSSGMTPVIADHLARRAQTAPAAPAPAPDAAPAAPITDRLAGISGSAANMLRPLPLRDTTGSPTVAALPYQPPDASIVPEDIARRDAARPRPPAPAQDGPGGSVDALMQASMMPDQAAGRGTPARAPFAPASRPAAPAAQAGVEASLGERLSALGRGYAQGGLVGAIGDMMQGGEGVQRNATYRMLVARGLPPEQARDVVRSPAILQQILPSLFGNSAPQIVNIPGPYGTQTSVYWDAQSRRFQPAEGLMPGAPPPAQAQPGAPAVAPPPVLGAQAPTTQGQPAAAAPPALNLGGAGAPAAAPAPAAPAAGGVPPAPNARGVGPRLTEDGQFVIGNATPQVPAGSVHRMAPGGQGYLYTRDGRPVFENAHEAQARGTSTNTERDRALAAIESARRVQVINAMLDRPFDQPYRDHLGNEYSVWGDVIGPWATPQVNSGGNGGVVGQIISGIASVPAYAMQTARNIAAQRRPEVAATRRALNELETAMTALQSSRVRELFGSSQLSDADREAAARTVGTLNAQDATALRGQLSVGERESLVRIATALRNGLISRSDVPPAIIRRAIELGVMTPAQAMGGQ